MTDKEADSALDRAAAEALALFARDRRTDGHDDGPAGSPAASVHDHETPTAYFPFGEMPIGSGVVGGGRASTSTDGVRGNSSPARAYEFLFADDPFGETASSASRPPAPGSPGSSASAPSPEPAPRAVPASERASAPASGNSGEQSGHSGEPTHPSSHSPSGIPMADLPPRSHSATPWPRAHLTAARAAEALPAEERPLGEALGQVLAEPLDALTDLPSFDTSAMDGWAVSGPGPWRLPSPQAAGGVLAGSDHSGATPLRDGHAVRIATGARVPPGATAVLRSEHGEVTGQGELHATRRVTHGQDIRPRGQECRHGDHLLPEGTTVSPAVAGLAAAAGYDRLRVTRRPRVEILVLGDELLREGLPQGGRIRDALGPMLGPWLAALGTEVIATRRLGDDADVLHDAFTSSDADLVLTTGGTAAGPVDHVHPTLRRVGAELLVDGVAVRPGHPMLLARLAPGRHLVGLPGNPLAAVAGLLTLAEPLLRTLSGSPAPARTRAALAEAAQGHPTDTRLMPVLRLPGDRVRPLAFHGPAMLRGLAAADALAVVPPGGAAPGDAVSLLGLPWAAPAGA
ncbi:molybdopterin molybdotransferase MoeA [Streptomyces sp. NPDC020379]|uniref:molybdopterin molybdotransferase MoeA n=1 Tax=Streptomyces sp. NPDC020379 TaxID=3365071 RepID=UPI0037B45951